MEIHFKKNAFIVFVFDYTTEYIWLNLEEKKNNYFHLHVCESVLRKRSSSALEALCLLEGRNLFPSWPPVERTLPAFGAGISRWLNPEQLVVMVVFHNPDPFSWCPTASAICFLCWLGRPPIFFPQTRPQKRQALGLINCLLQRSDLLRIPTRPPLVSDTKIWVVLT